MFGRLKSWLFRGSAAGALGSAQRIAVGNSAEAVDLNKPARSLAEFWKTVSELARGHGRRKSQLAHKATAFRLPKAAPGVVPDNVKPAMAMDSQIADTYQFGAAQSWDGSGFMGYAYLAELTQIPEFRIPCEKLANDATRKWGRIVSTNENGDKEKVAEKIAMIDAEFRRLNVQECYRRAFEYDGEFGKGQIWFDLGEDEGPELATNLDIALKVKKGSLKRLQLVEPIWTYPNKYNSSNPLREDFYRPETWYVLGQEVHASRMMTFISRPVPDILKPAYMFGGIALIQLMWVCVENWMRTRQSVSDLIHAFSVMVLKSDLAQELTPAGAQNLALRAQAFNELRDNLGLMILNDQEDLTNVAAPLGSLDKLQAQSQEHMAAVACIPLIVLFGLDPAGLNATGDGQIRVYNQSVEGLQARIGTPNMRRLLDIVQMSLFEEIDDTIQWQWEPLWTMTAKEEAEIRKLDAETDCGLIDHGVVDAEEVRGKLAGSPDSGYSSIDVDDLPEMPDFDHSSEDDPTNEPDGDRDAKLPKIKAA